MYQVLRMQSEMDSSVLSGAHAHVQLVAVKSLKRARSCKQRASMAHRLGILQALQHPHVVRYHTNNLASGHVEICIVMEAWGVSVATLLACKQLGGTGHVYDFGTQMLQALICLHGAGIVHGDVKPANVVFASNVYKLCDLDEGSTGSAFYMSAARARRYPQPSPEDSYSDTYALGMSVLEVLCGRQPYCELENQTVAFARVCGGHMPRAWTAAARMEYDYGSDTCIAALLESDALEQEMDAPQEFCRASPEELLALLQALRGERLL